jgi:hypothetical protein
MVNWKERLTASGIHLSLSLAIAAMASPYREISGGRELFMLVVGVDVIIGPLITLVIFNRAKPRSELRRDLAMVGMIQLAALGYGLWSVSVARPVHLVFEIDRFRVVHAVDVPEDLLVRAPPQVQALPWSGPTLLAVRPFRDKDENMEATLAALQGLQIGARPDFWEPYAAAKSQVLAAAKPVLQLKTRFGARAGEIDAVLARAGRTPDSVAYVPMVGRNLGWTAFVDRQTANVVAFMPLDSF